MGGYSEGINIPVKHFVFAVFLFVIFTALLQGNIKANQDAFLNVITQAGGPVDQAMKYLNKQGILQQVYTVFKYVRVHVRVLCNKFVSWRW